MDLPVGISTFALLQGENPHLGSAPLILLNPNAGYPDLFIAFTGAPLEVAGINQLASDVGSNRIIPSACRKNNPAASARALQAQRDSGDQRQRAGSFRLHDPDSRRHALRTGNTSLFAARAPNASVLWAGIACSPCVNAYNNRQSVCRNKSLHAGNHR